MVDPRRKGLVDAEEGDGHEGGFKGPEAAEDMPRRYRQVNIDFSSKRGLDGFDFGRYNTTSFAGLENILPNTYTNAVIQMLFFVPEVRLVMLHQQYNPRLWDDDKSLGCELGFLFHMLHQARNAATKGGAKPCQSASFLRVFRHIPEAVALGLLESKTIPVQQRVESFHRFLLTQLHLELAGPEVDEGGSPINPRGRGKGGSDHHGGAKGGRDRGDKEKEKAGSGGQPSGETVFDSPGSEPIVRAFER